MPTPRYIRFAHDRVVRWKIVPTKHVVLIANHASRGADWGGSNKGDILDSFEQVEHHGYAVDRERFGELMDKAVTAMKKVRQFEDATMGAIFKET